MNRREYTQQEREIVAAFIKNNASDPIFRIKGSDNDLLVVRFAGRVTYTIECPVDTEEQFVERTIDAAEVDADLFQAILEEATR